MRYEMVYTLHPGSRYITRISHHSFLNVYFLPKSTSGDCGENFSCTSLHQSILIIDPGAGLAVLSLISVITN